MNEVNWVTIWRKDPVVPTADVNANQISVTMGLYISARRVNIVSRLDAAILCACLSLLYPLLIDSWLTHLSVRDITSSVNWWCEFTVAYNDFSPLLLKWSSTLTVGPKGVLLGSCNWTFDSFSLFQQSSDAKFYLVCFLFYVKDLNHW